MSLLLLYHQTPFQFVYWVEGGRHFMQGDANRKVEYAMERHGDMLYRTCLVYLASPDLAEDALQETFIRYLRKAPVFNDGEHEKAWLIRVATNICRDMLRFRRRRQFLSLADCEDLCTDDDSSAEVLEMVLRLPQKLKEALILHYVEGYKVKDIATLLGVSTAAVKKRLQYAREKLKLELEREENE